MTREELVQRLAQVSHDTYMRHRKEPPLEFDRDSPDPTRHDSDRAEDIVAELERLDVLSL